MTAKKKHHVETLVATFKNAKDANDYLQLADAFLEYHPEIIYWTERNSTKKGVFYKYVKGVYREISTLEVEQMLIDYKPIDSHIKIPSMLSQGKIMETMNNIQRRRFFYRDNFNPEGIINFQNGFFDIEENALTEHTMNIISTCQLPYPYDPQAECPNFMMALNDATENDPHKIQTIQEFAGYCLTRETNMEKVLFLIGASRSGKSTVLDGITAMLGDENVSCATMEKIGQPRYAGLFIDKIANIATEIPKTTQGFEESLKAITSGEKITIDTKFIPAYDARPYCKMIFAGNDLPAIADTSDAIFERMLLVYFNNVIPKEKRDAGLKKRIKQEGAGIFNWAMAGRERLLSAGGFTQSNQMLEDLETLKIQNNGIYYFVSENYEVGIDKSNYVVYDDLYEHYQNFCKKVGVIGVHKKIVFGKELRKIFHKELTTDQKWVNGTAKRVWFGMRRKAGVEHTSSDHVQWGNDG
jgi:putative DNA primase/helicase